MNIRTLLFSIFLLTTAVYGQQKSLDNITSFRMKNSGTLMDSNNNVDGYYFYYEVDKLKKGMREYAIKLLDNNLNEIAQKTYIDKKNTLLAQSKFNNQALMFNMINLKEDQYKLISFDRKGDQIGEVIIPIEKREKKWLTAKVKQRNFDLLYPVDDKGFLFNYQKDNKKIGYALKYIATDGGKSWEYKSPEEIKEVLTFTPLQASEDYVIGRQMSKPSLLSKKLTIEIVGLDINTGEKIFSETFSREEDPRLISNVFVNEKKQIVILGEYFEPKDNVLTSESQGLFLKIVDRSGKEIKENKVEWASIEKFIPSEDGKKENRGYIYFHDIIRTQKGAYVAIGEKFRKTISLKGMLLNGQIGSGMTQLTITDGLFAEFDENFDLKDITVVEKGKSRVQNVSDFGSPLLNAHAIKSIGGFDYQYSQIDESRDRFYAMFLDYERLKGEKNKYAFKSIIYSDDKFTEDKIYLENSSRNHQFRILPGKLGNVMLMEYDKKEKTLDVHLEQLNIN